MYSVPVTAGVTSTLKDVEVVPDAPAAASATAKVALEASPSARTAIFMRSSEPQIMELSTPPAIPM